jgi:hypothetical protein
VALLLGIAVSVWNEKGKGIARIEFYLHRNRT